MKKENKNKKNNKINKNIIIKNIPLCYGTRQYSKINLMCKNCRVFYECEKVENKKSTWCYKRRGTPNINNINAVKRLQSSIYERRLKL